MLDYSPPDKDPGRKQYTPSARELESPRKSPDQMSVEELVEAAEFALKEVDPGTMKDLVVRVLKIDPDCSHAHILLGIHDYTLGALIEHHQGGIALGIAVGVSGHRCGDQTVAVLQQSMAEIA